MQEDATMMGMQIEPVQLFCESIGAKRTFVRCSLCENADSELGTFQDVRDGPFRNG